MHLSHYTQKMVRVQDRQGRMYTGIADVFSRAHALQAYGRDEEGLRINGYVLFTGDMASVECLPALSVIRATQTYQQAGAYYVRIQAMARKHHITLREEFDEHDTPDTKYIVVTDADFPVATARMYPESDAAMMIGRVVVLPEYRHRGMGTLVVHACEEWAGEMGYTRAVLDSRENKVGFYEELGYAVCGAPADGETFRCIRMEKAL